LLTPLSSPASLDAPFKGSLTHFAHSLVEIHEYVFTL